MDLEPGDVFAGHRIEGVAGRGGMGVVYRAIELALDRVVALKTIAPSLAADPSFRARFVRESKAAAAIDHPNVLPVFSAGEQDGVLFIAMRYVDGADLRSLIRTQGRLPVERAASLIAQVAAALDSAHARGLVHRDVKPANVLVDRNEHAYLTDFGLTKRLHSEATAATRAGGWVGTLGYVAPEQIRDEQVDGRTDQYALGCVLVHALTGRPPFERTGDEATLWAHLNDPPPDLPDAVPEPLRAAVARALAKQPEERFRTTGEFGRAVLEAIGRAPASVEGLESDETRITPAAQRPDRTARFGGETAATAGPGGVGGEPEGTRIGREADRTARIGGETAATVMSPRPDSVASVAARRRRRIVVGGVLGAVVVGGGVAAALIAGAGEDDPAPLTPRTAPPPKTAAEPARDSVRVGARPTGLAVARGSVYVTRPRSDRLSRISVEGFEKAEPSFRVTRGTTDLDAGLGALWATSLTSVELLTRIDLETGKRREVQLPDGTPVAVEVTANAVWVGIRGSATRPLPVASIVRIDPRTLKVVRKIDVPDGVQDIAVGSGGVWVSNRGTPTITRIDIATGRQQRIGVGPRPGGIALGGGAVWVAGTQDGIVRRIDRRDPKNVTTVSVGAQPRGVAYGAGGLWAASFADSTLTRLEGRSGRRLGEEVELSLNPLKVVVSRGVVYAISLAEGRVDRIRPASGGR